jgi:hypothetical protein
MGSKHVESYKLTDICGVTREYTYPKQEKVKEQTQRMRLFRAAEAIVKGEPVPEELRQYIAAGLETIAYNTQSRVYGDKGHNNAPFPIAGSRGNILLSQTVYLLNQVLSIYGIESLHHSFPDEFPELKQSSINNHLKRVKKIRERSSGWAQLYDIQTIQIKKDFADKKCHYFKIPNAPIEKIDFNNDKLWIEILNKCGKPTSS